MQNSIKLKTSILSDYTIHSIGKIWTWSREGKQGKEKFWKKDGKTLGIDAHWVVLLNEYQKNWKTKDLRPFFCQRELPVDQSGLDVSL